ncbi:sulfatase family protein [Conexibacter woesei]|uniref:Sulfatase n=1 Tax=Conexibacter woesei (strain DSM 14684 / CCUG 47730 / CIP 108061 / JCM 11494 / NBRC 100937 / ID131577) TaxID=469383 RepID=D3FER0_CONWI|nr:sulfatase [Conexibacter woesei]ADB49734.1 sulfatase [Conexibacter woesei DSM 14684]
MEQRIDRRTLLGAAGAGVAGGALLAHVPPARARAAAAAAGPNVLVLVLDSLRYDHVGANGNAWIRTPNIDALARESVRFTRAFPEAMPTVPARRSLLTSRRVYPWTTWRPTRNLPDSPGWTGLGWSEQTWLRALRAHGYWTGYVTDNPFLAFASAWKPLRRGVDRFMRIGGQVGALRPASTVSLASARHWLPRDMQTDGYVSGMRQHLANLGGARDEREQCCARVFSHALDVLGSAQRSKKPFALVVDCFDPHEPWAPVRKYRDMYGDDGYRANEPGNVRYRPARYLTGDELRRLPQLYAAAVTQTDAWLGHFLGRFYDAGLADSTAIVLLSDHGIVLGDRGWTGKPALQLHPELIQVPFLLRAPDRRGAGTTSGYFASPHDVGPTLLAMTGVPRPERMDGADLSPLLSGGAPATPRPFWFGGYANHWYYRDDRWALIADGNNRGRGLYDLRKDPGERDNVASEHLRLLAQIHGTVLRAAGLKRLPYFGAR